MNITHKKIHCFVGGGSGGHIIPALNVIKENHTNNDIIFFSSNSTLDCSIIQKSDVKIAHHITLHLSAPPTKKVWSFPLWVVNMIHAVFKSLWWLYKTQPQTVTSMGGFVTVPVVIAARLLRIPVTLYELNVEPGKATRLLAPFANILNVTFSQTTNHLSQYNCTVVEYPLAKSIQSLQKKNPDQNNKKTLLIMGGSQGSVSLNTFVYNWIQKYQTRFNNVHIIHQTGTNDTRNWNTIYQNYKIGHTVLPFEDNIHTLYQKADYIICRAGAGTLFEVKHLGIPCLIIPLETSYTKHQRYNALAMQNQYPYQFRVVLQQDINSNPEHAYKQLTKLMM